MIWNLTIGRWSFVASSLSFSYMPPAVSWVDVTSGMSTQGGDIITLWGTNFGPPSADYFTPLVVYGPDPTGNPFAATLCEVATNQQTSIMCTTVAGVGNVIGWTVTIGGQASISVVNGSYAPPVITNVSSFLFDTAGGQSIVITGGGFGPAAYGTTAAPITVRYGPLPYASRYHPKCTVQGDATITCTSVLGCGAGHAWFVTVGGQTSAPVDVFTSYLPPTISSVSGPGATASNTAGGGLVSIQGTEFADGMNPNPLPVVHYGPTSNLFKYLAVGCTVQTAQVVISCVTARGVGHGLWYTVTIDGQSVTFNASASYAHPVIASYSGPGSLNAYVSSCARDVDAKVCVCVFLVVRATVVCSMCICVRLRMRPGRR